MNGWILAVLVAQAAFRLLAAAPPNDNLVNAIALTGTNLTVTGTNVGASKEIGEPNHAAPGYTSVWWKWTAPASGSVVIKTAGSDFDTLLAAYTGSSVNTLSDSLVTSNDDTGSANTSLIAFNVLAGTTYRIVVDGFNGATGLIQLTIEFRATPLLPQPLNDNFTNRIVLSGLTVDTTGENFFATKEPKEPNHADELGGASVWWTWTAPTSGTAVISSEGSSFEPLLAVYTGSALSNLVEVANNDSVRTNQPMGLVNFHATQNTAYQIAVDGFNGEPGYIQLHLAMTDLVVLEMPQRLPTGEVKLSLQGVAGKQYALEASTDLVHWDDRVTLPALNGSREFVDSTALPRRFYRARELP